MLSGAGFGERRASPEGGLGGGTPPSYPTRAEGPAAAGARKTQENACGRSSRAFPRAAPRRPGGPSRACARLPSLRKLGWWAPTAPSRNSPGRRSERVGGGPPRGVLTFAPFESRPLMSPRTISPIRNGRTCAVRQPRRCSLSLSCRHPHPHSYPHSHSYSYSYFIIHIRIDDRIRVTTPKLACVGRCAPRARSKSSDWSPMAFTFTFTFTFHHSYSY